VAADETRRRHEEAARAAMRDIEVKNQEIESIRKELLSAAQSQQTLEKQIGAQSEETEALCAGLEVLLASTGGGLTGRDDATSAASKMQEVTRRVQKMQAELLRFLPPKVCQCGSQYVDDAEFCRKCGVRRPTGAAGQGGTGSPRRPGSSLDTLERALRDQPSPSPSSGDGPDYDIPRQPSAFKPSSNSPRRGHGSGTSANGAYSNANEPQVQGKLVSKLRTEIVTLRQEHGDMDMLMSQAAKALNREVHKTATLKNEVDQLKKQLSAAQQEIQLAFSEKEESDQMMEEAAEVITKERTRVRELEQDLDRLRVSGLQGPPRNAPQQAWG